MNNALIFAGGSGSRMNSKARPKQFLQFYGKELIIHTLDNFQNHPEIDGITIVCLQEWIPYLNKILKKYEIDKVLRVVSGGKTGQESIFNGLAATAEYADVDSVVLIHDGVRPFINDNVISECIKTVKQKGSAITVVPAIETIVSLDGDEVSSISDRSKCFYARAPQCFILSEILDAHEKAIHDNLSNFVDSASIMSYYGHKLFTVKGNIDNIKITTPADFYMFKALFEVRENQQIFGI